MIVIDASTWVNALVEDGPPGDRARHLLAEDTHWAAPEHFRAEAFSALRGLVLRGEVDDSVARGHVDDLSGSRVETFATGPLLPRMWELRHNATGHDAAYIAVAERTASTLVTADARLAAVPGIRCAVVLVA